MKILFVHPELRPGAPKDSRLQAAVAALRARGAAVLISAGGSEALQVIQFHGRSIDLAIVHREGQGGAGEAGLALIRQFRAVPTQQDLPLIVTTSAWSEAECARHQNSSDGVHAYFPIPAGRDWKPGELCSLVNAVTAGQLDEALRMKQELQRELEAAALAKSAPSPVEVPLRESTSGSVPAVEEGGTRLVPLNELSDVFQRQSGVTQTGLSIQLELPPEDEPAIAVPVSGAGPDAPAVGGAGVELELELSPSGAAPSPAVELSVPLAPAVDSGLPLEFPPLASTAPAEGAGGAPAPVFGAAPSPFRAGAAGIEAVVEVQPESEIESQFPYLFSGSKPASAPERGTRWESLPPVGDAIVPGGAAQSPDTEVLKKYLALREEDVAALSRQLKLVQERNQALEQDLAVERARGAELAHESETRKQKIGEFDREKVALLESRDREILDLGLQVKTKNERILLLELQLKELNDESERLRNRVRDDLRRIRVREKELENRIEVMKRDQEALLATREARLGELKRRTDLLEFNNELLSEQLTQERKVQEQLRNQLARVAQAVRAAGGLLQVNETIGEGSSAGGPESGDGAPKSVSLDTKSRQNRVAS